MTQEEADKQIAQAKARLQALRVPNVQGGASGAFVNPGGAGSTGEEMPPAFPEEAGMGQKIAEMGVPMATSMVGAASMVRATAPLAVAATEAAGPLGGAAVVVPSAVIGAYGGGAAGTLSMEGTKRALNLPGAPDSFDEAFQAAKNAGTDAAYGELWGQGIGAVASKISPYRRAVSPESAELFDQQATRLRSAYEELAGTKLIEKKAWYNPMRWGRNTTELDDDATVQRLIAQGIDPNAARSVALTGGMLPSKIETTTFSKMWGMVTNSKSVVDPQVQLYNQARSKLVSQAALKDLGTSMNDLVPPEQVGELVRGALNGRVDTLVGARRMAANAVGMNVPTSQRFNLGPLKKIMPKDLAGRQLITGMPDNLSWEAAQEIRMNLGMMSHDEALDDLARGQVKWLAERLDERIMDGLPTKSLQKQYRIFTQHDDAINGEAFNTSFVQGLLSKPRSVRAYADRIINDNDVGNFRKLERSLSKADGGMEVLSQVKGSISQRFLSQATKEEVIQPNKLIYALGTEAKGYGKYFLTSTMGPEYAQNFKNYAKTMDTINDVARKGGHALGAIQGIATATTVIGALSQASKGTMGVQDAAYIATSLFAPMVVAKALASPTQAKILLKVAHNVAVGANPKTTARLAMRLTEFSGYGPSQFFRGTGVLPEEQEANIARQAAMLRGQPPPATGGPALPVT